VEKLFGYSPEELINEPVELLIPERFRGTHPHLRESFGGALSVRSLNESLDLCGLRKNGDEFPVEISLGPLATKEGFLVSTTIRDITGRKLAEEKIRRSLLEKDVMLNEIHHRVKNNLQLVSSLLSLQAEQIQDTVARRIFTDSQNRIQSMALIHQQLYSAGNFAEIDFAAYLRSLANHVLASYANDSVFVSVSLDVAEAFLSLEEAVPCGLIVNELISNSLKHSFHGRSAGEIRVGFGAADGIYTLTVDDDGSPLPSDVFANRPPTMGVRLVQALTSQLGGEMQIGRGPKFSMAFPDQRGIDRCAPSADCRSSRCPDNEH
jgi:PAS domain S-box-containing protein